MTREMLRAKVHRIKVTECDVANGGRALSRRLAFTRDGHLVASMAQEQIVSG